MRSAIVVALASPLLRHSDGQLSKALRVRSQASRGELVAEERHQVVADLPGDAARELLGQVVRQPGALDAKVAALELGDVRVERGARSNEATKVDCCRGERMVAMVSQPGLSSLLGGFRSIAYLCSCPGPA